MPTSPFSRYVSLAVCAGALATGAVPASAQEPRLAAAVTLPALAGAATPEPAEPAAPAPHEWFGSQPWHEWGTVTGDWNTLRSRLTERGFTVAVGQTTDLSNVSAAAGRRATVGRGLFDTNITAGAELLRVKGGSALVQLQWLPGRNGTTVLGDAQGFSNIDADDVPLFGEAWYEQRFGERVRAKAGRIDANSEFAFVDAASDFLSASMGFSPSIVAMPTYPTPAAAVVGFVQPVAALEIGAGVFNGSPEDGKWTGWDSRFDVGQVGARWTLGKGARAGRVTAGAWRWRDLSGEAAGVAGLYVTAEQTFWTAEERTAAAFVQVGASDRDSETDRHVGAGVSMRGLSRRRAMDVTGIGLTRVRLLAGEELRQTELAIEAFHRVVLTPSVSVIPDVQVIRDPGGDVSRGRAVAFTTRVQFDF